MVDQEAAELQREERIAARHSADVLELRPRQRTRQPAEQNVVDRLRRERRDVEPDQPIFTDRLLKCRGGDVQRRDPARGQDLHRLTRQPVNRVSEDAE